MKNSANLRYYLIAIGMAIAFILPPYLVESSFLYMFFHLGGVLMAVFADEIATFIRKELK